VIVLSLQSGQGDNLFSNVYFDINFTGCLTGCWCTVMNGQLMNSYSDRIKKDIARVTWTTSAYTNGCTCYTISEGLWKINYCLHI